MMAAKRDQPPAKTAYVNARLLDPASGLDEPGGVLTNGESIAAFGPTPDTVKSNSKNADYQLHVFYSPEDPVQGCPMKWQVKFLNKFQETEFLNQVQYDFLVVDDNLKPLRSLAQEQGRLQQVCTGGSQTDVADFAGHAPGGRRLLQLPSRR